MSAPVASWGYTAKGGWLLMAMLAAGIGVYSLRYSLPHVLRPLLTNFVTRRGALSVHAVCASVALLVGPWQFLPNLRARRIRLHRALGRIYVATVLFGWIASIPVGLHAETGAVASAGFLVLGACWVAATGIALARILQGDVRSHRRWMIRSYALTAAAITLRLYLGAAMAAQLPFAAAYPAIAWLCWVPNLALVELALRWPVQQQGRTTPVLPATASRHGLPLPRETAFGAIKYEIQENEHA